MIFDSETSTRSSPGSSCPMNYQKLYEKHPSSTNLIKSVLFRDCFCNNLEISYTAIKNVGVSIKEVHYSNKKFCNINFFSFLIIFFFMYKKHEVIIGFIIQNNIFRHLRIF